MPKYTLHGVPLSQPFRATAWALLQKRVPFAIKIAVPGVKNRGGTLADDFRAKSPLGVIPLLEDADTGFMLGEAPAQLTYLAEAHGWSDLYPTEPMARAKVCSYMSWHHNATRQVAFLNTPIIRPDMPQPSDEELAARHAKADSVLATLADGWLGGAGAGSTVGGIGRGGFLGGAESATIADLLCYEEVVQVSPRYANVLDVSAHPRLEAWFDRMAGLPYHDAAHASIEALGDLRAPNEVPIGKRLGAATKAGLTAYAEAQAAL